MQLERDQKRLLEAIHDRYSGSDIIPTFEAIWVEEPRGRQYYRVTGQYRAQGGEPLEYQNRHSRGSLEELQKLGLIKLDNMATDKIAITITDKGATAID